jgi:hypothetical protein
MEQKSTHGGRRPGSGRRPEGRSVRLGVVISPEAMAILNRVARNKSEFIDKMLRSLPDATQ